MKETKKHHTLSYREDIIIYEVNIKKINKHFLWLFSVSATGAFLKMQSARLLMFLFYSLPKSPCKTNANVLHGA